MFHAGYFEDAPEVDSRAMWKHISSVRFVCSKGVANNPPSALLRSLVKGSDVIESVISEWYELSFPPEQCLMDTKCNRLRDLIFLSFLAPSLFPVWGHSHKQRGPGQVCFGFAGRLFGRDVGYPVRCWFL